MLSAQMANQSSFRVLGLRLSLMIVFGYIYCSGNRITFWVFQNPGKQIVSEPNDIWKLMSPIIFFNRCVCGMSFLKMQPMDSMTLTGYLCDVYSQTLSRALFEEG
jgi:hypothetical protein